MKPSWICGALALIAMTCAAWAQAAPKEKSDAERTLVIFNTNDPTSSELARFYAARRGVAKDRVLGLKCSPSPDITREEYDRDIAEPLRRAFEKNRWWRVRDAEKPDAAVVENDIRFIAVIRGVPVKIAAAFNYAGDEPSGPAVISTRNEAAVDSELTTLGFLTRSISGALNNPYYRSFSRITDAALPNLMLVARLDAPTPEQVKRMITDSLATEQAGLRGFAYVDARGIKDAGLAEGDKWLLKAADDARRRGSPVVLDLGEGMFPQAYPMRHAALYLGWYSEHVAGPFVREDFRFVRGAVAVHIHSFSASNLRDAKQLWVGPLLAAGAAATVGNVYEPYLSLTPNLDVFHERLRAGFTLAESAWSAQRALSWMNTVVGDPLYRPFRPEVELSEAAAPEWDAYRDGLKVWLEDQPKGAEALTASAKRLRSGIPAEGLGLLQLTVEQPDAAIVSFELARSLYTHPDDIIRAAIHEIFQLRARNRKDDALALIRGELKKHAKAPSAELLRSLEMEMAPPPPPPPAPAAPVPPAERPAPAAAKSTPARR